MLTVNPQIFRFGLIGLGSALLIYALNVANNTSSNANDNILLDDNQQKPSAYLTESTFNIFNAEGKRSTLYAAKAFFFSNNDDIAIDSPMFSTTNSNSIMKLTALKGHFNPSKETLSLEKEVKLEQITNNASFLLTTEKLDVNNKLGVLSSSEKVTITNGNHSISGIGFEGSINQREIKLLSKVKGKYVFAP